MKEKCLPKSLLRKGRAERWKGEGGGGSHEAGDTGLEKVQGVCRDDFFWQQVPLRHCSWEEGLESVEPWVVWLLVFLAVAGSCSHLVGFDWLLTWQVFGLDVCEALVKLVESLQPYFAAP